MTESRQANAPLPDVPSAERRFVDANGVTLHAVAAGDSADPLVVLLHGFPEFWYEWSEYVGRFVDAGYRVLIPDQRGYNLSDRPDGVRSYRTSALSADVASLVEAEGRETAHVIGHDWGGAIAWDLSLRHPGVVDRLGIVNVPHPTAFERTLRSSPRQLSKSWYAFVFQLPRFPEWALARNDFDALVTSMREPANDGAFDEADFERYRRTWSEPGALTAAINWYRARARHYDEPPRERVAQPTLIVWGENDQALVPELAPTSLEYCEDATLARFPHATHWVVHEHPDRVSAVLLDHLEG
ncbi:alpha/beta fold hydrolase [Natrarchaeobius oligotrophus]|uniref:Alpha/beta hydrolase n=1 Tax=Natrarchaeobius chitinivorans TaxID=1679083 RepID=A0A3N6MK40_NATCH|nr:alpha/beta hydrolase [Natrarchaeobius chitinivorans]RQH01715.1 alpha/beta hydrolase [Natrarchaeobius chitinivorans]